MRQGRRSGRVAEELPLNANPPRTRSLPLFVARRSPIVVVPPFQLIELFSNKLLHLLHLLWSSGGWIHEGFPLDLCQWVGGGVFVPPVHVPGSIPPPSPPLVVDSSFMASDWESISQEAFRGQSVGEGVLFPLP